VVFISALEIRAFVVVEDAGWRGVSQGVGMIAAYDWFGEELVAVSALILTRIRWAGCSCALALTTTGAAQILLSPIALGSPSSPDYVSPKGDVGERKPPLHHLFHCNVSTNRLDPPLS